MPLSMTAYANAEASHDWGALSWEIRTLNHRYLEPSFRLPDTLRQLEMPLREQLAKYVQRGKVDCTLVFKPGSTGDQLSIDLARAQKYITAGEAIAQLINKPGLIAPMDILDKPGVKHEREIASSVLQDAALALYQQALEQLVETRQREGDKLAEFIRHRLTAIAEQTQIIRLAMPELVNTQKQKLLDKLSAYSDQLDNERLEQELIYIAQKADIDEELDRLEVHVSEIYRILDSDKVMGRRLDFLMQELNREANTLAAKSSASSTTHAAVELKVLIEQIREQIQNLE